VNVINSAVFPIVVVIQAIIVHIRRTNMFHNKSQPKPSRSPTTKKSKRQKKKKKKFHNVRMRLWNEMPMHREIRTDSTITDNDALDVLGTASDGGRRFIRHVNVACNNREQWRQQEHTGRTKHNQHRCCVSLLFEFAFALSLKCCTLHKGSV
jgi:hypothetical protein